MIGLQRSQKYSRVGVKVNDKLQTSNSRIFAAGDCCSSFKFTHGKRRWKYLKDFLTVAFTHYPAFAAADFMARIVIRNALFFGSDKMSNLLIPYVSTNIKWPGNKVDFSIAHYFIVIDIIYCILRQHSPTRRSRLLDCMERTVKIKE